MFDSTKNITTPWSIDSKTIPGILSADVENGLSSADAAERMSLIGPNKIESGKRVNPIVIFINQFVSPFVLLLAVAAALSFYFNEWLDGIAIVTVIVINAVIGFIMESQAERSMEALKKLTTIPARILRDGKLSEFSSEQVVPGDVLFVESGDMVTADARVIKASQLQTDESALTGESLPVAKQIAALSEAVSLAERNNMLYKGTFVTTGNGYAVVINTGMSTELGNIANMVQNADQAATPLEKKIQLFSKKLIWVTAALVIIIFIAGLLNGQKLVAMLETSIALAVAAIPEGLPIVTTLALAFGMLRMARHNVIVKKLSSVETLGGTTVICTDKTGTLTQNKIEAALIQVFDNVSRIEVNTGIPSLHFIDGDSIAATDAYKHIRRIAALCNTAAFHKDAQGEQESGDPLEVSLLKMVFSSNTKLEEFAGRYPKLDEIPFSSDTKVMATLHADEGGYYIAAKGAVEELLKYCTFIQEGNENVLFTDIKRTQWLEIAEKHAQNGLRMLAFAFSNRQTKEKELLGNLTLAGLIGFIDPPRPEVFHALEECRSAGIKVVMITGDHPATARNVALQLSLMTADEEVIHGASMKPYNDLTEEDKVRWMKAPVFARVNPKQKLDLVSLFQEKKMVVGMTGDGVNDAPALKKADIGIAMGQRGTQVAQEVADMVLKDDAFSSIVLAIKQGRVIFDNIRKFVIFLLSCNLSELLIIATASILNLHFQLFPLQILFINLVTDVLPALALGVTDAGPHIMERKPYASQVAIIDKKRWTAIFTYSIIITVTTIGAVFFSHEVLHKMEGAWNKELCNNILFYSLIFTQILHVFNMSFEKGVSFFKSEIFRNKYVWYATLGCIVLALLSYWMPALRKVLEVSIYGWSDWAVVIVASFISLFLIQLLKRLRWVI